MMAPIATSVGLRLKKAAFFDRAAVASAVLARFCRVREASRLMRSHATSPAPSLTMVISAVTVSRPSTMRENSRVMPAQTSQGG